VVARVGNEGAIVFKMHRMLRPKVVASGTLGTIGIESGAEIVVEGAADTPSRTGSGTRRGMRGGALATTPGMIRAR